MLTDVNNFNRSINIKAQHKTRRAAITQLCVLNVVKNIFVLWLLYAFYAGL